MAQLPPSLFGILAIIFWGSNYALTRSVSEQLGPVTAATAAFLIAGVVGTIISFVRNGGFGAVRTVSIPYLLVCGSLFVVNMIAMFLSAGLALNRQQVLEVTVVNYLWPGLLLLLSVCILKNRATWTLVPGIVIALAGVTIGLSPGEGFSWSSLTDNVLHSPAPYGLAFLAAVTWALFSNLARHLNHTANGSVVPLFILATGVVLLIIRVFAKEEINLTIRGIIELLYMAIFPLLLAPVFWDYSMRKGNLVLLASLSYFIPLLSVLVSALYLRVRPEIGLWVSCGLVVTGAVVCRLSVSAHTQVMSAHSAPLGEPPSRR